MAFSHKTPTVSALECDQPRRMHSVREPGLDATLGAVFVIARKGPDLLETPVFHAGKEGDDEAVAVFTDRQQAQQYLDQARWNEADEVGHLSAEALMRWLLEAREAGIRYVVVNPDRVSHVAGQPQPVLFLGDIAGQSADTLLRTVQELAQG